MAQNPVILRGSKEDSRNGRSPVEGIETIKVAPVSFDSQWVEMEEARLRALKLFSCVQTPFILFE